MEQRLRVINTFALIGILVVLILILIRLPQTQHFPTAKDFMEAKGDQSRIQKLQLERPLVIARGN